MLIEDYGVPSFIKIDVEGFEYEVIKGLSHPVKFISFEFTPEYIESSIKIIDYISKQWNVLWDYPLGESMKLTLDFFVIDSKIINVLYGYRDDNKLFGDVYCITI